MILAMFLSNKNGKTTCPKTKRHYIFYEKVQIKPPPELSRLTELPPKPKNQTSLTLNFQYRTNYPPRLNTWWFCPTWRTRGTTVSIFFF